MTPQEKADELVGRFSIKIGSYTNELVLLIAVRCAIVCVDEIIICWTHNPVVVKYWEQVKQELEKL